MPIFRSLFKDHGHSTTADHGASVTMISGKGFKF